MLYKLLIHSAANRSLCSTNVVLRISTPEASRVGSRPSRSLYDVVNNAVAMLVTQIGKVVGLKLSTCRSRLSGQLRQNRIAKSRK